MNNKYIFQFIVYLLLGTIAMAGTGRHERSLKSDLANAISMPVQLQAVDHEDQAVFISHHPAKKQTKFRTRFRAASYLRISHVQTTTPVETYCPLSESALQNATTAHLPPFYYLFLFRLTPF
ncbi:hypothetical protein [Longitalea luteola]|uniref:hypothetical protein n=1 Tax=Longitalea luteola TaxID=2812563 RepID=UPI001A959157|nr:hypothetical protein [Longitalea luteola]